MMRDRIDQSDGALRDKERRLAEWLRARGSVLIGFSGGVDSAYLACVAVDVLGTRNVLAVIGKSASYPEAQWEAARNVARRFGVPVLEVDTEEIADPRYAANPTNRCYFCKSELWSRLTPIASAHGMACVIDGTNADDLGDYRPGARAAAEWGIQSPLAELGFAKTDIRELSRVRGLPTWRQPSAPCLSSRIPYGTAVTAERLRRIEAAEASLRALGIAGDLRVRFHGELARIELSPDELRRWLVPEASARLRGAIVAAGFFRVAIDLRGFRSGSLNVLGGVVADSVDVVMPNESAPAA
jgi:pyridinium-3,5-biscarboxylic acid mononucleotide sulfurtransferase